MTTTNKGVLILLDADVIIHFIKAERFTLLGELFQDRLVILDIVLDELRNNPTVRGTIDNIFRFTNVKELSFPTTSNWSLLNDYLTFKKKTNGYGESACLAYCKHFKHIIASSNTKDIVKFCNDYSIAYLTTLDILCIAINKNKITRPEANVLIRKITKNKKSCLCCQTIEEHIKTHFETKKVLY